MARRIVSALWTVLRWSLLAWGALMAVVTFTPLVPWTTERLLVDWTDSDGDVLVVPAAGMIDIPGVLHERIFDQSTYWRAVHAVQAWNLGHFRTILVLGYGSRDTVLPVLLSQGVPRQAIEIEDQSRSTHENAVNAAPILRRLGGRQVLLTSDYHMFRAWRCFRRAGVPLVTRPFPDLLKRSNVYTERWQGFCILVGEGAKIAYYWARGWI